MIEQVRPQVDCGRHPVKRLVGDTLEVSAVIYKDGHDLLAARVRFRGPGDRDWRVAPLAYSYDDDLWSAALPLDRIGRWAFTVEAWPDRFGSWREGLRKWMEAGADVSVDLRDGAALLRLAAPHRRGKAARSLEEAARRIADDTRAVEERATLAFSADLAGLGAEPLEPADLTIQERVLEVVVDRRVAGFAAWYELFPRSQTTDAKRHGTFADAERRLPKLAELGFDVVYLPPIHPIGRIHRKGRNNFPVAEPDDVGSPWAIGAAEGGHTAVHPELGKLEDFEHFVETARKLGLEVALDFALQCAPDHPWVREHPEWFHIRADGSIRYAENPPKKYQDIYPLNFWCENHMALWEACRDALLFWIERGVTTFRVDNPHTKPLAFWEWAIGEVKAAHPEVVFLAEAFTRPHRMKGLAKLGFTQSYTYFTWKNTLWELAPFVEELTGTEMVEYYRPNFFANTPDILHEYLQTGGRAAFRVRLVLAATLAPVYGIYSGFELCEHLPVRPGSEEYLDSEKYQIRPRDWEAPGNILADVAQLNRLRRSHAALQKLDNLQLLDASNENLFCYWKSAPDDELLCVVNLDPHHLQHGTLTVPLADLGIEPDQAYDVEDLLTGEVYHWHGASNYVRLDPAERVAHVLRVRVPTPPPLRTSHESA